MAEPVDGAGSPAAASEPQRLRSGDYRIDLAARGIRRNDDAVDVEAKVFDLIALLIAHPDRALSKREIGDALWPDRAVTDAALSQLLRKARRALGDDGEAQALIRTVHGRGLQWVGVLEADEDPVAAPPASGSDAAMPAVTPAAAPPRRRRPYWLLAGLVVAALAATAVLMRPASQPPVAAPTAAPVRIVLLPTVERSGSADLAWVRNGLPGLIGSLLGDRSGIETLTPPETSGTPADLHPEDAQMRRRLREASGATHAAFTELRTLGSLVELDLRVVALDSGVEYREVLRGSTPAAIAVDAAARMGQRLRQPLPDGALAAAAAAEIQDPFVGEAYARGIDAQMRGDQTGAKKYFDICLDHDPALLWPRLHLAAAQIATDEVDAGVANAERVAEAARRRGLVAPYLQATRQLAGVAFRRGDIEAAAAHLDTALADLHEPLPALAQIDLLVAYGSIESERGRRREARGRFDEALARARALGDRRREASALFNLAVVENADGDAEAAIARLRGALDAARAGGDGGLEAAILLNLGGAEHNAGRSLDAATLLQQGLRLARERADRQVQVFSAIGLGWVLNAFDRAADAGALGEAVLRQAGLEGNAYWEAEARWLLSALAAGRQDWAEAFDQLEHARALYAARGMQRNVGQVLAETVQAAGHAGDAVRAHAAADAYRRLAAEAADARPLAERLPLIDAQLRHVDGDAAGATDALAAFVAGRGNDRGPVTQAAVFELGRWQLDLGRAEATLALPALTTWLADQPAALALRIDALRAAGRTAEAAAMQDRLDALKQSPQLDLPAELRTIP